MLSSKFNSEKYIDVLIKLDINVDINFNINGTRFKRENVVQTH